MQFFFNFVIINLTTESRLINMQRYFVKSCDSHNNFIIESSDLHHIKNVMRNIPGDKIEVVHECQVYTCIIKELEPLTLEIVSSYSEDRDLPIELTIAVGLVNEQKFDLILQKLTELGVNTIIPLKMERSIVKLDENKTEKKLIRWEKICKEASEQSHRLTIPKIMPPMTLKELITYSVDKKIICSLNDETKPLDKCLNNNLSSILFVIGPEGGISPEEEIYLRENNFESTTLGKRVLRVETAAIYIASIVNYIYKG